MSESSGSGVKPIKSHSTTIYSNFNTPPDLSSNSTESTHTTPESEDDNGPPTPKMPVPVRTRTASILRAGSPLINQAFAYQIALQHRKKQEQHQQRQLQQQQQQYHQQQQQQSRSSTITPLPNPPLPHSYGASVSLDPRSLSANPDPVAIAELQRIIPQLPYRSGIRDVWAMLEALRVDATGEKGSINQKSKQQNQQPPRTPRTDPGLDGTWDTVDPPPGPVVATNNNSTGDDNIPIDPATGADFDMFLQEIADCGLMMEPVMDDEVDSAAAQNKQDG